MYITYISEPGEEIVATVSESYSEEVQVCVGSRGSDVGDGFFSPKKRGGGGYQGIGIVEVVCKICTAVVNFCLKRSVILHDSLHGFRVGSVVGTLTLEERLAQQLTGISHKPLFRVFLDVCKAYDSLDRGWCVDILWGDDIGQNMAFLIAHQWENQQFVPKARIFLWEAFFTGRGVAQVNPASPMIFNIVVGEVVRAVLEVVCGPQEAQHVMGWYGWRENGIWCSTGMTGG